MITVDVVLPCLDEAECLPSVLRALPAGCRALVVDDGSTDDTGQLARGLGARVVLEPRHGHGAAAMIGPTVLILVLAKAPVAGRVKTRGMDTPQVSAALLQRCHQSLIAADIDALLGPAEDGGWWVLGLRDPRHARRIAGVRTSRADTGARTAQALRHHGLHLATVLPAMCDVDTAADARRVAGQVRGTRFAAAVAELSCVH